MYVYPHITHPYIFYVTFIICSDSDSVCFSSVLYWYPVFHHDLRGLHFLKPTKIERYILHRQFNLGTSDSHLMIFSWVSWMHSLHMNAWTIMGAGMWWLPCLARNGAASICTLGNRVKAWGSTSATRHQEAFRLCQGRGPLSAPGTCHKRSAWHAT